MRHDVFISGFGGQGVLLAGNLLAYAAINEGMNVSFFPAYGVEKRGGAAMCTVVVADGEVGSPVVGSPSVGMFLNQTSFDKYAVKLKQNGICIVNSSLVNTAGLERSDLEMLALPMNDIAIELGDARMVNMVAIGAYAQRTAVVSLSALADALRDTLPERNHSYIPANIKALQAGAAGILVK